jgi:tetratricopeptide (TPR) repeat protein
MPRKLNVKFLASTLVLIALLGVGVHLLHGYQVKRNASSLLRQAERAEEAGDIGPALDYLGRYLAFAPDDTDALTRYGHLLEEQAKRTRSARTLSRAYFTFDQVLRRDASRRQVRRHVVDLAMGLERYADARQHLGVLLQESPANAELEELLGRCEESDKAYGRAAEWYGKAIQHAPHKLDNYVRLAQLYRQHLDQPARAEQVLGSMIKANGQSFQARLVRARYRLDPKDLKPQSLALAAEDVAEAQKLAPDDAEVIRVGAEVAQAQGRWDEARRLLRRGLDLYPKHVPTYLTLVSLELKDGKAQAAEDCIVQGLKEVPEQGDLLYTWASVLLQQGQGAKAEEVVARLRQLNYAPLLVDLLQARLLGSRGEWGEARQILERIRPRLTATPELIREVAWLLGQSQEHLGNADEALLAHKEALALDPTSVPARIGAANAFVALGRLDEALVNYRQAVGLRHAPPETRTVLARVLIVRNMRLPPGERNWKEVREELARAAQERPDAVEVPLLQAQVLVLEDPGRLAPARELLEQARDRRPDQVELWVALVDLAEREGKPAAAVRLLEEAQQRPKLVGRVELRLARIRLLAGRPPAEARPALDELERGLGQTAPSDREALERELAEAYFRVGATAEAERLWNQLAAEQPRNLGLRMWLFDRAVSSGKDTDLGQLVREIRQLEGEGGSFWRYAEANRLVRQALQEKTPATDRERLLRAAQTGLDETAKLRPTWFAVPALRAQIDEHEQHRDKAVEDYREAVRLGDRRPAVVQRLVQLLLEQRRFAEADQAMRKLVAEDQAVLSAGLGKYATGTLLRSHNPEAALQLALRSIPPDSKNYLDHLWLGQTLWMLGKEADAKQAFLRARALAPDKPETWVALVHFLAGTNQKQEATALIDAARGKLPADQLPLALGHCYEALGQAEDAEKQYAAALSAHPHEATILAEVALFYLRLDQPQKTEPLLRQMLEPAAKASAVERGWARRTLAGVLAGGRDQGQHQEALALIEQNLRDGTDAEVDKRAKAVVLAGRPRHRKEAIQLLEDLAWKGPLAPDEQFLLAQLYEADGHWHKAQVQMSTLLGSPEGKRPAYLAYYVRRLLQRGEAPAAGPWLAELEKADPQALRTLELKARVLKARGEDAEAVAVLKELAHKKPADTGSVAMLLDRLSQEPDAKDSYRKAAEEAYLQSVAQERKPEGLLAFAEFLGRQRRLAEALDRCEEAMQKGPTAPALAVAVGALRAGPAAEEQQARVQRWLREALDKAPDSAALRVPLADLYDLQGRYPEAAAVYRQILQRNERHLLALNNLAWLLAFQDGKAPEALTFINRAIEIAGPSPELLDTHAVVALANGNSEVAIAELQEAVAAAPTATKYLHLAQAYGAARNRTAAVENVRKAQAAGLDTGHLHPFDRKVYEQLRGDLGLR